jgi:hypothetical protein
MDATRIRHWEEVRILIHESYRLIAPKKSLAKLEEVAALPPAKAKAKASGPKRSAARIVSVKRLSPDKRRKTRAATK